MALMRSRYSIGLGLLALCGFAVTTFWHLGEVPMHFYLPDTPAVEAIDHALTHTSAPTATLSGMTLDIPSIGVQAQIEDLREQADGQLETPAKWQDAGWYVMSAKPGQPGTAVVVGHVDSHTGPAVFYQLHRLKAGDEVRIASDGSTFTYRVTGSASYPETSPKLAAVFSNADGSTRLALLTCSGDFNRATQRYNDRLLVSAAA